VIHHHWPRLTALLFALLSPLRAQGQDSVNAATLLASMAGQWDFTVRAGSRGEIDSGVRVMSLVSPHRLEWVDSHDDGTTTRGHLVFDETSNRFEYRFQSGGGEYCTVTGVLVESGTIRFGREGPCFNAVLESFLRMDSPNDYVFARTDLGLVGGYTRSRSDTRT
jgi:hypothetical protein